MNRVRPCPRDSAYPHEISRMVARPNDQDFLVLQPWIDERTPSQGEDTGSNPVGTAIAMSGDIADP